MPNFIFDLDGTVVKNGQPIIEPLANALINISKKHTVIFASARPVRDMLPLIPIALHQCTMIGCNGGMAWRDDRCLFSNNFNKESITEILALLKKENNYGNIPYVLDGNWGFSCSDSCEAQPTSTHEFHDYIRSLSNEEKSEHEILTDGVTKVLILDGTKRECIEQCIKQKDLCINYHRHDDLFDITPSNENKYDTLHALNIDLSNSIVFGNDSNDFKMLENAQYSVFLGEKNVFTKANLYSNFDKMPMVLTSLLATLDDKQLIESGASYQ